MHVIGQLRIATRADGETLARKVDRAMANGMDDDIQKRLGECFDEVGGDRSVRIDRLEVDLGNLSWSEFERDFSERVSVAVMEKIRSVSPSESNLNDAVPKRRISLAQERLEAWLFFLSHGHLPWWFAESRWQELASVRGLSAEYSGRLATELLRLAKVAPAALLRLARHASAEDLESVIGNQKGAGGGGPNAGRRTTLHVIGHWLAGQAGGKEIGDRLVAYLSAAERADFESTWKCDRTIRERGEVSDPPHRGTEAADADLPDSGFAEASEPDLESQGSIEEFKFPDEDQSGLIGLPVGTAGLVLLHPFLGRLFSHLGWLDDAGGIGVEYRWHAVQALQFLARGVCGLPEPTLVLEKTLCGIPLEVPAGFPILEDSIRSECESMLGSVIAHWSALGNTSVAGLRESFLTRPGVVVFEKDRILLSVERRPYDMLLSRLPWSLGLVVFRWLERPIHVRWREGVS